MDLESEHLHGGALGAALEREHREIDEGIEAFLTGHAEAGEEAAGARLASLRRAIDALRRHIYLEEEFLFPPMQSELAIPTAVMLREHGEIWATLDALEAQLEQSGPRDSALGTCEELTAQLDRHNSKEEPIFYTQADTSLNAEESAELEAFLDAGHMPSGWICQAARAPAR